MRQVGSSELRTFKRILSSVLDQTDHSYSRKFSQFRSVRWSLQG